LPILILNFAKSLSTQQNEKFHIIHELNKDSEIHGIIVQLPLPAVDKYYYRGDRPTERCRWFYESKYRKLFSESRICFCAPKRNYVFEAKGIKVRGENIVVIGKAMSGSLFSPPDECRGTVTVFRKDTRNLSEFTKNADIIVIAAGSPNLLKKNMVRSGATIIDVGFTLVDGKIRGDADFEALEPTCLITPVPGGVGPMTVAMLMENTYLAMKNQVIH
jgi:methylenetetrahydrofolate dehydrogenase (NADP+)/methenyltetrahydrofolate cyclohydrolase